jgi:hypothetical protein
VEVHKVPDAAVLGVVVAIASFGGAIGGAYINTRHLRQQTQLEEHIRTATRFSELVGIAYGYGEYIQPQKEVLERILTDLKQPLSDIQTIKVLRNLINLSINMPVPEAKQVAAAEEIATLGIHYQRLRESALTSLRLIKEIQPKTTEAYDRLLKYEPPPPWWRRLTGRG